MTALARILAVGFLSAGTLAYELLLVRAFAIEHFHHFAFMAIGVAMLGFGVSGTVIATVRDLSPSRAATWFIAASLLTPVALLMSPILIHRIPLDPTQLPVSVAEIPKLATVYVLAALPFAVGAAAVLLGLTASTRHVGRLYGASLIGSGLGAAAAIGILWLAAPEPALALPAVLAGGGAFAASLTAQRRQQVVLATLLTIGSLAAFRWPPWEFTITPYKELPQVEAYPDAKRTAERNSPVGWVVAVEAPAFRYAPGLSLAYRGAFPPQRALFVDGQIAGAAARWAADTASDAVLDWLPSSAPYSVVPPERVLVIGSGGGTEVWNAVAHGADDVTAVELQPSLLTLSRDLATVPPAWARSRVTWVSGDARNFVARTAARYDLITLAQGGGYGLAAAGVHALNEDFLHTEEAYAHYFRLLTDRGVLAITGWLRTPPRESVRTVLTLAQALHQVSDGPTARQLIVLRSWGTVTVMARPAGFSDREIATLAHWARSRQFDLDWYPGLEAPHSEFNFIDEPILYRAADAAVRGAESAQQFAAAYPFDVTPATDARPYPHHFLRATAVADLLRLETGSWLPFAEWGYLTLLATLAQSAVLAALFLILPVAVRRGRRRGLGPLVLYFGAIGLAYLAAEIAAIQQLGLLLGHPVYAVAVVLSAVLISSGLGSAWSDRWGVARGWAAPLALAGLFIVYAVFLLPLVHQFQSASLPARAMVAFAALAPVAFLMGFPFPLGLRGFQPEPDRLAWAWAANGFSSVIAAPLAALVALDAGSPALFLVAAAGYAVAALVWRIEGSRPG